MEWCRCKNTECEEHKGKKECFLPAIVRLWRVDNDISTVMCEACASEAMKTGMFKIKT